MNKKNILKDITIFLSFLIFFTCTNSAEQDIDINDSFSNNKKSVIKKYANKKVLFVDSYHANYLPNMIEHKVIRERLTPYGISVKNIYMDAKTRKSRYEHKKAARRVKNEIDQWKPDLIITADDVAAKYLIKPYLCEVKTPVVFIGVNWDAKKYGLPCNNVTGQIEVELIEELINELLKYAKGKRVGLLTGDTITDKKSVDIYKNKLKINFHKIRFVKNFDSWVREYRRMQTSVDAVIIRNNSGIKNWNNDKAKNIIRDETLIPTGSNSSHLSAIVLISFAKRNKEFAEYASKTAIKIFSGINPSQIPLTKNKESIVYLNMDIAKSLKVKFTVDFLEASRLVKIYNEL